MFNIGWSSIRFIEKFVILYKISGRRMKAPDYQSAPRYWFDYLGKAAGRRRIYRRRITEIQSMNSIPVRRRRTVAHQPRPIESERGQHE